MARSTLVANLQQCRFHDAPERRAGNFSRNYLRGFAASQVDIALQRHFKVTKKLNLRFLGEFFDLFNHPNFGSPNNSVSSPFLDIRRKRWRTVSAPAVRMVA